MTITYFPKLTDTRTHKHLPLKTILDGIKTPRQDGSVKQIIEQIRTTPDKAEREELKKTLPLVTFGGKFTERRASALVEYSQIICLDFDEIECLEDKKEELITNPYIMACWVSPNGCGLKALVRVASNNHLAHSLALLKDFPDADPNAIKDVVRACFLSYDPLLFYNPKAEVYTRFVESVHTDEEKFELLKKWLSNKGEKFVEGNRNSFLAKLVGACNRFGIPKDFVWRIVERDYLDGSSFSAREAQGVINSIYTNYSDQFNTASFDSTFSDSEVSDILSAEIEVKDIITVGDLREDLTRAYVEGIKGGETTYYPELDNHFRWMRNEMTLVSGISNMGKSSILAQLLLNKMVFENKKFIFFSPEQAPPIYFYQEFVRTLIGKPLEKNDPHRMTITEYERALDFIEAHVFYVYPEKESPTPDYIHAKMTEAIIKYGADGTVIDPFSSMDNDYYGAGGRDDKFLEKFLNKSQRFAIQNNLYYLIVTHPKNMNKKTDGTFECPDLFDIANGSTWSKRMDNILMYHRPNFPKDRTSTLCELKSIKIKKQALNGKPGSVDLHYDWKKGRFYLNGFCPLDKFKLL